MVPRRLLLADEAEQFLLRVNESVVVVVRVFPVRDPVVVVVDVVVLRMQQPLAQNSFVPDRLEPAIVVWVRIGAVVVVVLAVGADEERTLRFRVCVVVPVVIGIDLEVVPDTVIFVIYVPVIVNPNEVVIQLGCVLEPTLGVTVAFNRGRTVLTTAAALGQ